LESINERDHSEDLGVDGRIMFKYVLEKQDVRVWSGFVWIRIGISSGMF
jgi:hypothetical protein